VTVARRRRITAQVGGVATTVVAPRPRTGGTKLMPTRWHRDRSKYRRQDKHQHREDA
jgi:hypothetical protein